MAVCFTISTVRGRSVDVVVHRTDAQMRRAAGAWHGEKALELGTQGVTHGFTEPANPQAVIRLCEQHLTRRVIDHEIVHAAQAIYGMDFQEQIQEHPLEHWTHHNETFAYLFTELHVLIYTALAANRLEVTDGF